MENIEIVENPENEKANIELSIEDSIKSKDTLMIDNILRKIRKMR